MLSSPQTKTISTTNVKNTPSRKIIVIGDSGVGKTSLTYKFCEGKSLESAEPTIGVDFRERTVNVGGEDIKLQLWDTAGQERFRHSMTAHYYRNAHAVIVMYDVTNRQSFKNVEHWIRECDNNCFTDIIRILVGNKCDGQQVVSTQEAQKLADKYNMPLFETSAKSGSQNDNVEAIFLTLAHKLKDPRPMIPKPDVISININSSSDNNQSESYCYC